MSNEKTITLKDKLITGALYTLVTALIGSRLRDHIVALVDTLLNVDNLRGTEKKARVMENLRLLGGDLGDAVSKTASFILSMAVDVVVGYIKARL